MCATVYALQVERIQAERHTMAVLIAAGGTGDLPSVQGFDLDIGMVEPESPGWSPWETDLRRELGLRAR